ncbi:MAG: metallopeptidase TldD-related protein [Planctomycetota bacterium]
MLTCCLLVALAARGEEPERPAGVVLAVMQKELARTLQHLHEQESEQKETDPVYFLGYAVTDREVRSAAASMGALLDRTVNRQRLLDVSVRVGDHQLDNSHEIRGDRGFGGGGGATNVPLEDDPDALQASLWAATDEAVKAARERFVKVKTNKTVKVEEEDPSPDFSVEEPSAHTEATPANDLDLDAWIARLRRLSARFKGEPDVLGSVVSVNAERRVTHFVSSEGSRLETGYLALRVMLSASTKADDGMELSRYEAFDSHSPGKLPDDAVIAAAIEKMIGELKALKKAPVVEPYTGPAILNNRASAVFFHEIFGHRMEGHRQKSSEEGQTFTKKLGEPVLPEFLSVLDDPTLAVFGTTDLNGHYLFDDEGVASQRITLVQDGVLKSFLMSRSPIARFPSSNGHGRREPGLSAVARQGNLVVESHKVVPYAELRAMLIEACKQQGKPYGFVFEDISGGFTTTQRFSPQSFKVIPLYVTRVYQDGRPDELVRGVDIVGTPLASFAKIVATADDPAVFNGYCGAESGSVPVSAIAPSILVSEIEIEKKQKEQDRPPLLPSPLGDKASKPGSGS